MDLNFKGNKYTAAALIAAALMVCLLTGMSFSGNKELDAIVPTPGFERKMLSDYFDGLKGDVMDTPVYVQNGAEEGGSIMVLGGTHPNEPAGYMTAVLILENARTHRGRLFVLPFGNISGFSNTLPQEASPNHIGFKLRDGSTRTFRYGSRDTDPTVMWPIPDIYVHKASGQELAGNESKNLNRAYPGDPEGTPTERLAFGIMELLRKEDVTLAFDLHEASPEYPVIEAIVAHEKSMELAAVTAMDLLSQGIDVRLEPSPKNLRGLSHREWGDYTDVLPILMETANPSQGRLRGRTDEALVLGGKDKAYIKAAGLGRLFVPYDEGGKPIEQRVARHVAAIRLFAQNLELFEPEKGVVIEGLPDYEEISGNGVGYYLSSGN